MNSGESCKRRPDINYPCEWSYKVIGNDVNEIKNAITEVTSGLEYKLNKSNVSKTGKYHSFDLTLKVLSEEERDLIFKGLADHKDIVMVI